MKIKHSKEMDDFFKRCYRNINSYSQNAFLGMTVSKANEEKIKSKLTKCGVPEFVDNPALSLFISSDKWNNSLYHKRINLKAIDDKHFSYHKEILKANELFNYSCIQKDPNHELNDWMMLRALDKDIESIILRQDGNDWMLDAPSEAETNDVIASIAYGRILTFGLGIGYFPFMCMQNPLVKEITVVEKSSELINMFNKCILPQFPKDIAINIIEGDAYNYYNKQFIEQYDFIYSDIWRSNDDGLISITKLLEQYHNPSKDIYFWIEDSCLEIMWTLTFIHFDEIYKHQKNYINPKYSKYMKKIKKYYANIDETVSDIDTLKNYMYNDDVIRKILSL